jgi:SAM-dependent methyltransferase
MTAQTPGVAVWEPLASLYEDWFETVQGAFVAARELEALARALPSGQPGRAVEVGAGTGFIARALCARGWRIDAVEPSGAMREAGSTRSAGLSIVWHGASAEALPFPTGTFDLAVFFTSLEFVHDPGRALAEALRVLRPGGSLLAGILDARSPWVALYRHLADRGAPPWNVARFFVPADLEQLVGHVAECCERAIFMAPDAAPPYVEADAAGLRAGNQGSIAILRWSKPS